MATFTLVLGLTVIIWTSGTCGCARKSAVNEPKQIDTDFILNEDPFLDKISIFNRTFVDSQKRTRIFHGINAVLKKPPWYQNWMLNDTRLQLLQKFGFNVIRLGAMWSGVEPREGVINETYMDILEAIVIKLKNNGMYVILDMHQDVASSLYGTYDGFPLWFINKFPPSPNPFPWPLTHVNQWAAGYLAQATGKTFQHLYNISNPVTNDFARYWRIIVSRFKTHNNVLGYEIINEPWAGDIYSNPELLLPGNAGRDNLQPLYNFINEVIRKIDDVSIIFYEPVTWGVLFNGTETGSGFNQVPGGPNFQNRSAFSYHYYCWILPSFSHKEYPAFEKTLCDRILGPKIFSTVQQDIISLGGGSFLTEFGLCAPDGKNASINTRECDFVMNQADIFQQSWAYWDSNLLFDMSGNVNLTVMRAFSRPYARIVSGSLHFMKFDVDTGTFNVTFTPKYSQDTEIYVPKLHYPNGFSVYAPHNLHLNFNKTSRILYAKYEGNVTVIKLSIVKRNESIRD